jgi:hypothetical protein
MGVSKYIYTVYDAKTGDFVAKGTAAQLAGKGLFKDAGTVSTCYRSCQKTDKPRRWRMERAEAAAPMPEPVPTADNTQQRRVYWYRAWNAAGELLGEGTAMDLVALGVFGSETTVHESYRRGGKNERRGVAKMDRKTDVRPCHRRPPKKKPAVKPDDRADERLCRIADPTPLQRDVRDLCRYNRKARKMGHPELSYGGWAVKGKPAEP